MIQAGENFLLVTQNNSHVHLITELTMEPTDWNYYQRMNDSTYLELLELVTPLIQKKDAQFQTAISPHEECNATLRFLATGRNYKDLKIF